MIKKDKEYKTIKKSRLFDKKYYLKNYNLEKENINPLIHYIYLGKSEKRLTMPEKHIKYKKILKKIIKNCQKI